MTEREIPVVAERVPRVKTRDRVRLYLDQHPGATYRQIQDALGIKSLSSIYWARRSRSRRELLCEVDALRRMVMRLKTTASGDEQLKADTLLRETDPLRYAGRREKKATKKGTKNASANAANSI